MIGSRHERAIKVAHYPPIRCTWAAARAPFSLRNELGSLRTGAIHDETCSWTRWLIDVDGDYRIAGGAELRRVADGARAHGGEVVPLRAAMRLDGRRLYLLISHRRTKICSSTVCFDQIAPCRPQKIVPAVGRGGFQTRPHAANAILAHGRLRQELAKARRHSRRGTLIAQHHA